MIRCRGPQTARLSVRNRLPRLRKIDDSSLHDRYCGSEALGCRPPERCRLKAAAAAAAMQRGTASRGRAVVERSRRPPIRCALGRPHKQHHTSHQAHRCRSAPTAKMQSPQLAWASRLQRALPRRPPMDSSPAWTAGRPSLPRGETRLRQATKYAATARPGSCPQLRAVGANL